MATVVDRRREVAPDAQHVENLEVYRDERHGARRLLRVQMILKFVGLGRGDGQMSVLAKICWRG